ncbi:MAG: helix-turn-helix domain-containing protein [Bacteroidetes bacterium]|nr:helix-turn-helix domain-containing protein [Bacteroidota bacterium]
MNSSLFDLVEQTNRSIFLTGKAGTGKTTFLNDFVQKTRKKYIVVAPTGIAAINAGGVTIHSMFGLPLRTFLPTLDRVDSDLGNNIVDLVQHFRYRKDKKKLLREIEIVVIDEVSMLRADVLDMVDYALRTVRRNQQKFGGVQMLFIGDLQQLPPVVRDEYILKKYYPSPFFFDSLALKELPLITVELTKVYRQTDEHFLKILNAIREGNPYEIDFDALNKRYNPAFEPNNESFVYLTSHNKMADDINQKKLQELKGQSYFFKAKIFGEFKENQYPNDEVLELKSGAQVMFIRNDASGERKYYNGKLAEITHLNNEEIWVRIEGSSEDYQLKREVWEHKKYTLGKDRTIEEEVIGGFEQLPIRLAWAVTIHKSQGLTFDRLIIDAGSSFASGQVYVALSRCRTLEGIVLKSKITPEVIFSNHEVEVFQKQTNANDRIEEILEAEKYDYAIQKIIQKTDCNWLKNAIDEWNLHTRNAQLPDKTKVQNMYLSLKGECENLSNIFNKFEKILLQKVQKYVSGDENWHNIEEKVQGAIRFFFQNIKEKIFTPLKDLYAETKGVKGMKGYNEDLKIILDDLTDYLEVLKNLHLLDKKLFEEDEQSEINTKTVKVPTHIITWRLFQEGKSVTDIAKERGVMNTTIIGHFSKFAEAGTLSLEDLKRIVPNDKIEVFKQQHQTNTYETLTEWKNALPVEFDFGEIRLLLTYFDHTKNHS